MIVKAKQTVFYNGTRRRPGEVFEFNGKLSDAVELVSGDEKPKAVEGPTIEQLREKLSLYGVKFHPNTGEKKLLEMIAEAEGKMVDPEDVQDEGGDPDTGEL